MGRYRKVPVEIEAELITDENLERLAEWCAGDAVRLDPAPYSSIKLPNEIRVKTLEGTMHAPVGHYLIKGVKGEFYPCRADIFEATYEPA